MLSRISFLGAWLIVIKLLLFTGSAGAEDIRSRCEAAMDHAARKYSKCLLLANSQYAQHGNPIKSQIDQKRCLARFDRRTTRAMSSYGADPCTSADLALALADRRVSYAEGIATTTLRGLRHLAASRQVPGVCADLEPPDWACVGCEYPEKNFIGHDIPARVKLGELYLDALKPGDLEEDLAAVMEGPDWYLKGLFGDDWPNGLTPESDLADLCWHYNSFMQKRSFTWVVRDKERNYLGCAYYFPKQRDKGATPAEDAQAYAWIRFGSKDSPETQRFYDNFKDWVNSPIWPNLNVQFYTPDNKQP